MLFVPALVLAGQVGLPGPTVEIGVDVAVRPSADDTGTVTPVGPRVTWNLSPWTALVISVDAAKVRQVSLIGWEDSRVGLVELRRALRQTGQRTISGFVGVGVSRIRSVHPGFASTGNPMPGTTSDETSTAAVVSLGLAFEQRLGAHVAVHEDLRVLVGEVGGVSGQVGLIVPVGRYPAGPTSRSSAWGSTPRPTGRRVRLTGVTGSETRGSIGAIDDGRIEVVTASGRASFSRGEVERIRVSDSVRNGVRRGAIVGGVMIAVSVAANYLTSCDSDDDCSWAALATATGFGYGAALGAIVGGMVDAAFDRPVLVFERGAAPPPVSLVPLASRRQWGGMARVRW
jgi:hypothetical protein